MMMVMMMIRLKFVQDPLKYRKVILYNSWGKQGKGHKADVIWVVLKKKGGVDIFQSTKVKRDNQGETISYKGTTFQDWTRKKYYII